MTTTGQMVMTEDQLITALKKVSFKGPTPPNEVTLQVNIAKKDSIKNIKNIAEKAIFTHYFQGTPAVGAFRSWAKIHWSRKHNVQIEATLEVAVDLNVQPLLEDHSQEDRGDKDGDGTQAGKRRGEQQSRGGQDKQLEGNQTSSGKLSANRGSIRWGREEWEMEIEQIQTTGDQDQERGIEGGTTEQRAPNNAADRTQFWTFLRGFLPEGRCLGDWNAVCNTIDASSKSSLQGDEESAEFNALCGRMGIRDAREVAEKTEGPRFTRAQTRDGKFTWSRLDRVYTSIFQIAKLKHHVNYWTSDHLPITAEVRMGVQPQQTGAKQRSTYFKVDHKLVRDNLEEIGERWKTWEEENREKGAMERFVRCL
ncbi:hypothetical protein R1sor_003595 [Riccia sorocarpa]|uniref:Endonuclease/exonuclease/phosphatase domain-containing protein n=1 Tax=Riccia sorocarpa TaxID=122646 RepID=A0ABD3H2E7_9MARC